MVDPTSRVGGAGPAGPVGPGSGGHQPERPSAKLAANLTPGEAQRFDAIAVRAERGEAVAQAQLAELTTLYEAREKARLSADVYEVHKPRTDPTRKPEAPEGWVRASEAGTDRYLAQNNLTRADLTGGAASDFRAELYVPDPASDAIPQDARPVLVFRGSTTHPTPEDASLLEKARANLAPGADWRTNADQNLLGRETDHYTRAMDAAILVAEARGDDFEIAGHSLGGGLGTAAAAVSGARATLFNASGLHDDTAERFAEARGVTVSDVDALVTTYQVRGDVLTAAQEVAGPVLKPGLVAGGVAATPIAVGADLALDAGDLVGRGASAVTGGAGDVADGAADIAGDVLGGVMRGTGSVLGWLGDKAGLGGGGVRDALHGAGDRVDGGLDRIGDAIGGGADDVSARIDDGLRSLSRVRAATDWAARGGLIETAMEAGPIASGERIKLDAYRLDDGALVARDPLDIAEPGQSASEMVQRHLMGPAVLPSLDAAIDRVEARR